MKIQFLIPLFLLSFQLYSQCAEDECGPPLMMPNYLCSDGETMAGPGDCIQNAAGQCYWEIITCPSTSGYLRTIEASFCMDECSQYHIETEIDPYFGSINVIPGNSNIDMDSYIDRFVEINLGQQFSCIECSAFAIEQINLSDNCQYPVDCFQDPCLVETCPAYPSADCVANYCGGCYADFYNHNGELILDCGNTSSCPGANPAGCFQNGCVDGYECIDDWENNCVSSTCSCDEITGQWMCTDDCNGGTCIPANGCIDLSGLDFGACAMVLGVGYANELCQTISGCGWIVDGVDYSVASFESIDECESVCSSADMTCDEINSVYESFHNGEFLTCNYDNDCIAVWGHCDVGLGGCHYSVNEESYPGVEIENLVEFWIGGDCMTWVCDCSAEPYAQCIDGTCTSAYCMSGNPAGCDQTGCDEGYECVVDPNECVPSWCGCDGFYGEWFCTEDCGGGTCVETGLLGDLNGDGLIDVIDIVLAVNAILSYEYDPMGDINGDGVLNVIDIILVINIILNF